MSIRLFVATFTLAAAAAAVAPTSADAQGRGRNEAGVPPGHRPPAGLCRIWFDGLPPGRQPAPVSCEEARRTAPRNTRVIYSSDDARRDDDRRDRDGRYDDRDRRDDRRDDRRVDRRDDDRDRRDRLEHERWERARMERSRMERDRLERSRVGRNLPRGDTRDGRALPRNLPRCDEGRWRNGNCDWDDEVRCRETGREVVCDRASTVNRSRGPLPLMPSVSDLRRNRFDRSTVQWLGTSRLRASYVDRDRDGTPERVVWTDARGRQLQTWLDLTGNRRADRVIVHR